MLERINDSRMNHLEERGNNATKEQSKPIKLNDPLHYERPMTRARTKKFKQALTSFAFYSMNKMVDSNSSENMEPSDEEFKLVSLISYFES